MGVLVEGHLVAQSKEEVPDGLRLRLGERLRAVVAVRAGDVGSALPAPLVAKVAVGVDADADAVIKSFPGIEKKIEDGLIKQLRHRIKPKLL